MAQNRTDNNSTKFTLKIIVVFLFALEIHKKSDIFAPRNFAPIQNLSVNHIFYRALARYDNRNLSKFQFIYLVLIYVSFQSNKREKKNNNKIMDTY